jgi:anti-anti-sigma factor
VAGSDSLPVGSDRSDLRLLGRQVGDDVVVVSVAGELDMATVPQLRAYLVDKTVSCPAHLVLDLSAVTFLASQGIAVLIEAGEGLEGIHGELHLTGVTTNRSVQRVLEVTGLLARFDIHDDEDDLLRRLVH